MRCAEAASGLTGASAANIRAQSQAQFLYTQACASSAQHHISSRRGKVLNDSWHGSSSMPAAEMPRAGAMFNVAARMHAAEHALNC